jgi:hypothetical protein
MLGTFFGHCGLPCPQSSLVDLIFTQKVPANAPTQADQIALLKKQLAEAKNEANVLSEESVEREKGSSSIHGKKQA